MVARQAAAQAAIKRLLLQRMMRGMQAPQAGMPPPMMGSPPAQAAPQMLPGGPLMGRGY